MKKAIVGLVSLSLFALPLVAFAQQDAIVTICEILQTVVEILLVLGLALAVIILIIGGIRYMTSGGDAEKGNTAKRLIVNAIIGIVIILAAVFIVRLVQSIMTRTGISFFGNPCDIYLP